MTHHTSHNQQADLLPRFPQFECAVILDVLTLLSRALVILYCAGVLLKVGSRSQLIATNELTTDDVALMESPRRATYSRFELP